MTALQYTKPKINVAHLVWNETWKQQKDKKTLKQVEDVMNSHIRHILNKSCF